MQTRSVSPEYIEKWIGHLRDGDRDMARIAAEKLGRVNDPLVITELAQTLRNRATDIRAAAAHSLGNIGEPAAVPALTQALNDQDYIVSTAAAAALGDIGHRDAVKALIKIVKDYKTSGDSYRQIRGDGRGLYLASLRALERIGTVEALSAVKKYRQ